MVNIKNYVLNWLESNLIEGRPTNAVGPREFSNGGWSDLKPWDEIYPDKGIFVGKDNSVWVFFKTPDNVKTDWLSSNKKLIDNQMFFNDIVAELAERLKKTIVRQRSDPRRKFRLSIIKTPFEHLYWDDRNDTPATIDYRRRMSKKIDRPEWEGYFGVELMQSTLSSASSSMHELSDWWVKGLNTPMSLYLSDLRDVTSIAIDNGFKPITDMGLDSKDFLNLTAWHGVSSDSYNYQKHLTTTRFQKPLDGYSIITPAWGEISFYAAVPSEERSSFGEDPKSENARWARPLYNPSNDVIGIWIEGEIRSNKSMINVLNQKRFGKKKAMEDVSPDDYSEVERTFTDMELINRAAEAATSNDFIDNTEILVAVKCFEGKENTLKKHLRKYGMDCRMPVSRQDKCLARTIPCYPDGISKMYKSNIIRGPFSVQMFPGALSMSGILRKTRPNCKNGILIGLTNGDYEYREIFTDIEAAKKESKTPVMLITGRQGSGKTMQALQMISQVAYDNRPLVFLNPKADSNFKPFFDHLGGITITMTSRYLSENPGMLDPFNFFEDRDKVFTHLKSALFKSLGLDEDSGSTAKKTAAAIASELKNRVIDKRNICSADVIFGNQNGREDYARALIEWNKVKQKKHKKEDGVFVPEVDGSVSYEGNIYIKEWLSESNGTPPMPQIEIRDFVKSKINTSPLWKALISTNGSGSELHRMMSLGKPVLIEWDGSLKMPTVDTVNYSDEQIDSVISITLAFKYAEEVITSIKQGGLLAVDEAWVLKNSSEAISILNTSAREWRERNIMLLLMTQKISDFVSDSIDDMSSGISRFLFMATPETDDRERELFFRLSGIENTDSNWKYMTSAGIKNNDGESTNKTIAEGFYVDTIYGFSGGILCGPWPDEELTMARTDAEGERLKKEFFANNSSFNKTSLKDSQYYVTASNFSNLVLEDDDE